MLTGGTTSQQHNNMTKLIYDSICMRYYTDYVKQVKWILENQSFAKKTYVHNLRGGELIL